jgi:hypothetical protein
MSRFAEFIPSRALVGALIPGLLAAGALAGAPLVETQELPPRPSIQSMETQALGVFRELATQTEVRKDEDGTSTIVFSTGQTVGYLYQYLDSAGKVESLRLNVGFDVTGAMDLKKLNTFNEKRRFVKAFLDGEGDPFLVSDLDVQFGSNPGVLRAWIIRFRAMIPLFEREFFTPAAAKP